MKKLTQEEILIRFINKHNNKFDYSLFEYNGMKNKSIFKCNTCGQSFLQTPNGHLKNGCPCCVGKYKTTEVFIEEAKKIHGNKYDYSLVEYKSSKEKIKIKCNTCEQVFLQTPNGHLTGRGCTFCNTNKRMTSDEFIEKAKLIHGDKYDYSLVEYKNMKTKIKIKCNYCNNVFMVVPDLFFNKKSGCPNCYNASKAEEEINEFLKTNGISFERHKRFENCKDLKKLEFDFYLPNNNLVIEHQGIQHFFPSKFGNNISEEEAFTRFNKQLKHDKIKKEYCLKNNIKIIYTTYKDKNICDIIKKYIIEEEK